MMEENLLSHSKILCFDVFHLKEFTLTSINQKCFVPYNIYIFEHVIVQKSLGNMATLVYFQFPFMEKHQLFFLLYMLRKLIFSLRQMRG